MSSDEYGRLAYLVLLLAVLLWWFFAGQRRNVNRSLQQALIWCFIFVGVIAVIGLWDDIQNTTRPTQAVFQDANRIEIPLGADGHYHALLQINGADVPFVIDTGASALVLTQQDARRAGLDPQTLAFSRVAQTANGEVKTAPVRLDSVRFGHFTDRDVRAHVNGGAMETSLLGMSYLRLFDQITITQSRLVLTR